MANFYYTGFCTEIVQEKKITQITLELRNIYFPSDFCTSISWSANTRAESVLSGIKIALTGHSGSNVDQFLFI